MDSGPVEARQKDYKGALSYPGNFCVLLLCFVLVG